MSSLGTAPRRGHTPIRSGPSSAPFDAMLADQQKQIDDLVQQKRTLEHTATRLRQALSEEQSRGADAVAGLQRRFQQERTEWIAGCDALQAIHRVAHVRTVVELDLERLAVLQEREAARVERLARLQRDYRLVAFQRRELELEKRVVELEREMEEQQREHEVERRVLGEELGRSEVALEARCSTLADQLRDIAEELATAQKAKGTAEDALSKLRIEHNALIASTSTSSTNLERTNLHLEGLKSSYAELEGKHAEAERAITDLRRQLEKWRSLETREGAEMDSLRRSRIELEVRVKELETRVEELEEEMTKKDAVVERAQERKDKYKSRIEQYLASIEEHRQVLAVAQNDSEQLESEAMEAKERLARAEEEIKELHKMLNARPKPSKQPTTPAAVHSPSPVPEDVMDADPSPPASPSVAQKSKVRTKTKSHSEGTTKPSTSRQVYSPEDVVVLESEDEGGPAKKPEVKKRRGGPPKKKKAEDDEDEVEIVEKPAVDRKGKRKASTLNEANSDDELPAKKVKKKAKDKHEGDDEDGAPAPKAKKQAKKQADGVSAPVGGGSSASKPAGPSKQKTAQKASAAADDDEEEDKVATPAKKKRKINLFPSAQPVSFDWNQLPQGGGGLDIPTTLSPVKEADPVPPRSVFGGRGGSAIGSFGSLGGRR